MRNEYYRYRFEPAVPVEEIEGTLVLAIFAVESLHGQAQVRLDIGHALDVETGTCVIDAGTDAGRDLNRLFVGFLLKEFGEDAVRVERLDPNDRVPPQAESLLV